MNLLNNLFNIKEHHITEKGIIYDLSVNKDNIIYKAHFPNMPITPGVCIVQLVKELLELYTKEKLSISQVKM